MKKQILRTTILSLSVFVLLACLFTSCAEPFEEGSFRKDRISENWAKRTSKHTEPTTTPAVPKDRDDLIIPDLSQNQIDLYHEIWNMYKDDPECKDSTINDVIVYGNSLTTFRYDEVLIGVFGGIIDVFHIKPKALFKEEIGEYTLTYGKYGNWRFSAFANGKEYTLPEAYEAGLLSDEEIRTFCAEWAAIHTELDKNIG